MYRPVPSEKKSTVPSRRGRNYVPSRPVVKNYMHRPVPSGKKIYTVPSRRDNFYLPSRPVMKKKVIVLYRPIPSRESTPTVPSRPIQVSIIFIILSSRPVFNFFPAKHVKTLPSRPVSNIASHEKALIIMTSGTLQRQWVKQNRERDR